VALPTAPRVQRAWWRLAANTLQNQASRKFGNQQHAKNESEIAIRFTRRLFPALWPIVSGREADQKMLHRPTPSPPTNINR